jgi:plastocyanin
MAHRSRHPLASRLAVLTCTLLLAVTVGGLVVAAAGAATSTTPPIKKVTIKAYKFRPSTFTVSVGTRITVKNKDGVEHDLAAVNGAFKTKYIEGGKSRRFTVKKPGTYKIVCTLHTYMTGKLTAT